MQIFGLIFIVLGAVHFLLTAVWRVDALQGRWGRSEVPLSRSSNTAWSIVIGVWGVAFLLSARPLATVVVLLTCFPILAVAGRRDYVLWKRSHPKAPEPRSQTPALFRHWRLLRWWLISLAPLGLSAATLWARHRTGDALMSFFFGSGMGAIALDAFFSHRIVSNSGLFTRERNPIAYWLSIALLSAFYALACLAAFL